MPVYKAPLRDMKFLINDVFDYPKHDASLKSGGEESEAFYKARLATAEFYYERLLPRAQAHASTMLSPSKNLMQLHVEDMAFTG
ncbi:MAG: acyl-CoA dehydrogenase C-terminal domain-containing protein [Marinobacter sp.]